MISLNNYIEEKIIRDQNEREATYINIYNKIQNKQKKIRKKLKAKKLKRKDLLDGFI